MKSVRRLILVSIVGFLTHDVVLGRTTHRIKNEDHYVNAENDISKGAPILPIEGGYRNPEDFFGDLSNDELENLYDMRSFYGTNSNYDLGSPYYYYMGSYYDTGNSYPQNYYEGGDYEGRPYDSEEPQYDPNEAAIDQLPEGAIISESQGVPMYSDSEEESEVETEASEGKPAPDASDIAEENGEPEVYEEEEVYEPVEREESQPAPYWAPSDSDMLENPYMMGIPAQLQSFPMFDPQYYRTEYEDYERFVAEEKVRREETEDKARDNNILENPEPIQHGRRVRRGFARALSLRNKNSDESAVKAKAFKTSPEKGGVILNADCRGGGQGRRQNPNSGGNGDGGATDAVGNGINDVAGAASDAAGAASGAAGDAVDTAADAIQNLRLQNNPRRRRQRNGNNNGRRVE